MIIAPAFVRLNALAAQAGGERIVPRRAGPLRANA
jgi:hypothetical protein